MEQKFIDEMCRCPYCFKKFSPEAVQFKAMTMYTEQDLEDFSDSEREAKKLYMEREDTLYRKFWNQYPGSDPGFEYESFPTMLGLPLEVEGGQKYPIAKVRMHDPEGFLYQVRDEEGRDTKVRICPHCHNPLPFEYGKYPVKYIAVVGITSSGKTVYLAQIMTKIKEVLAKANLTVIGTHEEVDNFVRDHRIKKGYPLPSGNTKDLLTMPLPLNVINNKTKQKYTLIFYDIAGENCVNPEAMNKYGMFIENANGIVMIIDPKQFGELFNITEDSEDYDDDDTASPEKVAEAMYNAFGATSAEGGKCQVPLAAALSKSDILKDYLDYNLNMFQDICYEDYDTFGFHYEEFCNINTEIEMLFKKTRSMQGILLDNQLKQCFPNHGYFAFSALNVKAETKAGTDGLEYSYIDEDPEAMRIEEPLFWLLHQMGVIEKAQKKQRKALIEIFVNAIFLYDDRMLITFNYKDGTQTVRFEDTLTADSAEEKSSDLSSLPGPRASRFICWLFCCNKRPGQGRTLCPGLSARCGGRQPSILRSTKSPTILSSWLTACSAPLAILRAVRRIWRWLVLVAMTPAAPSAAPAAMPIRSGAVELVCSFFIGGTPFESKFLGCEDSISAKGFTIRFFCAGKCGILYDMLINWAGYGLAWFMGKGIFCEGGFFFAEDNGTEKSSLHP